MTFGNSLSSEAVAMRQLRRWKRLWRRWLTRSHKRTSMGPSRSCWNGTTSAFQPEKLLRRGLEFHVRTINKSAHTKNETYLMILVYSHTKGIWLNVIARLEFELAYFEVVVQHRSHYPTGTTYGLQPSLLSRDTVDCVHRYADQVGYVLASWYGFREAGIHFTCAKTGVPWTSGGCSSARL